MKVFLLFGNFTKVIVLLCFIFFQGLHVYAQNQKVADSLIKIYKDDKFLNNVEKLELLRNLAFNETANFELSLKFSEELIALSKAENNYLYLHRGYYQKGNKKRLGGNLNQALDSYFKSAQAAIKAGYAAGEGASYSSIADVYSVMGNSNNAEIYYNKSIAILRKTSDTISLATALLNAGDEYSKNYKYKQALHYFIESGLLFKKVNYPIGKAYTLGDIGMVYAKKGRDDLAMKNIGEAIKILETLGDYYAISDYLIYMSDIYLKRNDWATAVAYAKRSLELAQKRGLKEQISKSNLSLSVLYEKRGDLPKSFQYYKKHIVYRDSVNNVTSVQKMADLRTNFEVSKKQAEVDLMMQQKRNQKIITISSIVSLVLVFFIAVGLFRRYRFIKKTNIIIEAERKRSDTLLLNILPEETAFELKE
ncbi:MAG TPA: tetratricopeptide repeat protein, partial [Flavobacterium sp.]|uniref:tetratricopeptide repeat protein n=1 Tax=Flavobacterium sp. TaxID=239 RepID=UPI002DBE62B8